MKKRVLKVADEMKNKNIKFKEYLGDDDIG